MGHMKYAGNKIFKLWISPIYQSTCGYDEGYDGETPWGYEGVIEGLTYANISADSPITFNADTEKGVIEHAISALKAEGFSGKLRWMNK